ncbi:formimidoylglutamase [Pseudoalteromonas sp. Cnat2-41]|uniref:formimidoylglutamase n=1 Tax=unclassified Pseudoalteromonas TaxID=194690 RepID=UPI001EF7BF8C|nr:MULTISPECIES: formimidoylglutamase [unclassified Pseudoalteromonas]MCF2861940.1 formimidoylglutamase [Pseudoalteromonas sp. CNAT2-18]MCG7559687.1 formimidoylglutamase [Pseudoalteromonas sp. CNAT2-18.1]
MNHAVTIYDEQSLQGIVAARSGEQRVWQAMALIDTRLEFSQALKDAYAFGIRYVILGIPEDIGPRANLGKGGAQQGFRAFLSKFLNLPVNEFTPVQDTLLLGEIDCQALQLQSQALDNLNPDDTVRLRALCENIDQLVEPVVAAILAAGLTPIVIGGGHNNCYPLLSASSKHFGCAINALNLDPHGDFRALEGRHSGNGFHYAARRGYLQGYHVIALDEQKNNQDILAALHEHHASYTSYHALKVATTTSIAESVNSALHSFTLNSPLAIELDVDAITCAPASAFNHRGVSLSEAEQYVFCAARTSALAYIHLCEAAPEQDPNGYDAGANAAGQILTALVIAFLRARYQR